MVEATVADPVAVDEERMDELMDGELSEDVAGAAVPFTFTAGPTIVSFTTAGCAPYPSFGYAEQLAWGSSEQSGAIQIDCNCGPAEAGMTAAGGMHRAAKVLSRPSRVKVTSGSSNPNDWTARTICKLNQPVSKISGSMNLENVSA